MSSWGGQSSDTFVVNSLVSVMKHSWLTFKQPTSVYHPSDRASS